MLAHEDKDLRIYSGKVRVRVCGLLKERDKLLLIKHDSIGEAGHLWSPPGGGVEFGESAEKTIEREFMEETGLKIEVMRFLFVYELINQKHHAIELFYEVKRIDGELKLGSDPEFDSNNQIMEEIRFISFEEINEMASRELHGIFDVVERSEMVFELRGLFRFKY